MARANEWWAFKFAPLLGTAYATAWVLGASSWALLPRLLLLLLALTVGATYVSLINDWTDRADDAASGQANRLAGKPGALVGALLAGCLGLGLAFGYYFWQLSPQCALLYLGAWVAYSLYSLPPARFKRRGLAGVLADAAGAHFFPQLLTAALVSAWAGRALPLGWLAAVGIWALACGLRNILGHQLGDAAADARSGVATFVQRRGVARARQVAVWLAFPAELLSLAALLALSHGLLPLALLLLYAGLEWFRYRVWSVPLAVAELGPGRRLLLNEYYEVFYPLAFLLLQCRLHPADGLVLGLHGLLFGPHIWHTGRALAQAVAVVAGKVRSR